MLGNKLLKRLMEKTLSAEEQRELGRRMLEDRQEWIDVLNVISTLESFDVKANQNHVEARAELLIKLRARPFPGIESG
ncbi:MAG: hypothetical protein ACR2MX_18895 [Cyclobacteriaceae bacterium]